MKDEERDINNNSGAILFVILISLFALGFEGRSNNSASESAYYSLHTDLAPGYYSSHSDSIVFNTSQLPVIIKYCGSSLYSLNLYSLNLNFNILNYNRKIVRNIILVQKTRLSIKPPSVWKYSFFLASREKEELPVLS